VLAVSIIRAMIVLMMETEITSETSANFYQTTRRNNPENSHLHIRRSESLESHLEETTFTCLQYLTNLPKI
jgi:hypothetical protein